MDREIPREKIKKRRRKQILIAGSIVLSFLILLFIFNQFITVPVKRSEILVAEAVAGNINATLNATGTIQPEFEEVITSPVQTRILKVLRPTGSRVDSGQSILELDLTSVTNQLNQSIDQLNLNKAQFEKARLNLEKTLYDLKNQKDIKKLKNEWYKVEVNNAGKLYQIGGVMEEEVKKAQLDYDIAVLELKQLENQITNLEESQKAQLQELQLNIRIQERLIEELERKVNQSGITSGRKGVITWVKDQIGSNVNPGEMLVRVADLTSYKVEGTISDIYGDRIYQGQEVLVRINDQDLPGSIVTIHPAVQNGFISFTISLDDKSNSLLRPHLKVDVFPVTTSKKGVILLPNESAFTGGQEQYLFVIDGNKAYRRTVTTGLSNYEYMEIITGIEAGEKVIVSSMKDYERRKSIPIKN